MLFLVNYLFHHYKPPCAPHSHLGRPRLPSKKNAPYAFHLSSMHLSVTHRDHLHHNTHHKQPQHAIITLPNSLASSVGCSTLVLTMVDCWFLVINGSVVTKPEGTCYYALKVPCSKRPRLLLPLRQKLHLPPPRRPIHSSPCMFLHFLTHHCTSYSP